MRGGQKTIGDIVSRTYGELLQVKNLGPMCLEEVEARLAERGLRLAVPGVMGVECEEVPLVDNILAGAQERYEALENGIRKDKDELELF